MIPFRNGLAAALALACGALRAQDAKVPKGGALFEQQCAACHALAQDGIGPPLGGVTTSQSRERLEQWIRDPARVLASGDTRAAALLRRYKAPMPSFAHLDRAQVSAILSYVAQQSADQHLAPFAVDARVQQAGPRLIAPVQKSGLVVEVEDFVQVPRLPGRTPYKGITLLRPDPREGGALIVCDLMGILYRVKDRKVSVFLDMRGTFPFFVWDPGVATGLGSFALSPDFARNGVFYTTHAETFRGSPAINSADIPADVPRGATPPLEWVLTEWRLDDRSAAVFAGTHREVLRFVTPTTAHASQEIAFAPVSDPTDADYGKLYMGIGDGGSVNLRRPDMAGHPRTLLGSILRIDPSGHNGVNGGYGIPPGNPFAQSRDAAVRKELWAYGFRNPHRMSWDMANGRRMIAVDIGESNAEEVNLVEPGGSYGWGAGMLEGTLHIDAGTDAKAVRAATAAELAPYRAPFGEYDHSDGAAITGGYVYRGPLAALQDKYVFGDIVTGRLFYMKCGATLEDHTIYEMNIVRGGAVTGVKALSHLDRAHLRLGYDDRTGDLFLMTKADGMVRRITAAYQR
ncbi:MAG TPA: PQQ-dependent sugar dehydrogenase [Opitutaceae bacterium]